MKNNKHFKNYLFVLFFSYLILPLAAHAYAGPSVAIGVVIVAITIILAFFSSLIIKIFKLLKFVIKLIFNFLSKIKYKIRRNKDKKIDNILLSNFFICKFFHKYFFPKLKLLIKYKKFYDSLKTSEY